MSEFARMLAAMAGGNDESSEEGPMRPIDEAVVEELRGIVDRYTAPCPFEVGELVTPRRGYNTTGAGKPHIVLEVLDPPIRTQTESAASCEYGRRLDMRVAHWTRGQYICHVGESFQYERWVGAE